MNKGVELLLKRMDSHPEEFEEHYDYRERESGKWERLLNDLSHRMEVIDRDNGHTGSADGMVRLTRAQKPLGFLSDEEARMIHDKLMQTRANMFERRVMDLLLRQPPEAEDITEQVFTIPRSTVRGTGW
jgi:hypothetical protein